MKYQYEKIVRYPGDRLSADLECGPVLQCVFHVHPELELTLVESSFGCRFIGASLEPFAEGDLVLIGALLPHHYLNRACDSTGPEWSRLLVVKFGVDFCGAELLRRPEEAGIARLLSDARAGLHFDRAAAAQAAPRMRELPALHGMAKSIKLLELLELLSRLPARRLNRDAAPEAFRELPDERLNRILNFIHRKLEENQPPTLGEAARAGCMTPQAFSSYFHRATRRGFVRYMAEIRIDRAASLLLRTAKPVREIAELAGYRNLSNFNRRFQRLRGLTPSAYRKKYRID